MKNYTLYAIMSFTSGRGKDRKTEIRMRTFHNFEYEEEAQGYARSMVEADFNRLGANEKADYTFLVVEGDQPEVNIPVLWKQNTASF